jgi:hypothetical protein
MPAPYTIFCGRSPALFEVQQSQIHVGDLMVRLKLNSLVEIPAGFGITVLQKVRIANVAQQVGITRPDPQSLLVVVLRVLPVTAQVADHGQLMMSRGVFRICSQNLLVRLPGFREATVRNGLLTFRQQQVDATVRQRHRFFRGRRDLFVNCRFAASETRQGELVFGGR